MLNHPKIKSQSKTGFHFYFYSVQFEPILMTSVKRITLRAETIIPLGSTMPPTTSMVDRATATILDSDDTALRNRDNDDRIPNKLCPTGSTSWSFLKQTTVWEQQVEPGCFAPEKRTKQNVLSSVAGFSADGVEYDYD